VDNHRRTILRDPELVELFADDPEALAVLDAIADTQDPKLLTRQRRIAAPSFIARRFGDPRRRVSTRARAGSDRRRPRRLVLVGIVVVAVIAVVGPAFGLIGRVIDFGGTPRAHGVIVRDFGELERITALHGPGAITGPTRRVYTFKTSSRQVDLYAAPARHGYCWGVSTLGAATCVTARSPAIEPLYSGIPRRGSREPSLIAGATRSDTTRVSLTFEDGHQIDLPVVAVSKPISADFFLYQVPPKQWRRGARPSLITVFGPGGQVEGHGRLMYESSR
jgi:hypothetical protein